jgi:4-hydroxy-tetrahydrodipicolinate synthase
MKSNWRGTGVALITPFGADGKPDLKALAKLVDHVVAGGVDYLVPMGTTAESVTLADDEIHACVDTVLATNNKRLPILLGCGGNNTAAIVKKMDDYAKRYAVQGFLSVSPYYNRPQQEGIYQHYKVLSKASPLPIMLYNVPPRTGSNVLPETVIRIANDFKNIVAVKEASGSLEQGMKIVAAAPKGFETVSGDDNLALPGMALGFTGLVSVAANAFPKEIAGMVNHCLQGDFAAARALHYKLLAMLELLFKEGNPAGIKAACAAIGIGLPATRLPVVAASTDLQARIAAALKAL